MVICLHVFIGIRLSGGNSSAGRVEIQVNYVYGTVCDDNFDNNAAKVVCRSLGQPWYSIFFVFTLNNIVYYLVAKIQYVQLLNQIR